MRFFILMLLVLCAGCESITYYSQAVGGQLSLMSKRQSISALLKSENLDANLKRQLSLVEDIRAFAEDSLALPVGNSYSSYVDLQREKNDNFVVWNVFAAPQLSLLPRNWCYPVIGCAQYRGFFRKQSALEYAALLDQQGVDTYVGGVKAYSTLGWMNDPILSTFVHYAEGRLVALLFHELAHKVLYISDDTEFNESFASAVAEEGLQRWLLTDGRTKPLQEHHARVRQREHFLQITDTTRQQLAELYEREELSDEDKLIEKTRVFEQLHLRAVELTQPAYQHWLKSLANNASLVPVHSYNRWLSAFKQLLADSAGDMPSFYSGAKHLGALPSPSRLEELQKLTDKYSRHMQQSPNGK